MMNSKNSTDKFQEKVQSSYDRFSVKMKRKVEAQVSTYRKRRKWKNPGDLCLLRGLPKNEMDMFVDADGEPRRFSLPTLLSPFRAGGKVQRRRKEEQSQKQAAAEAAAEEAATTAAAATAAAALDVSDASAIQLVSSNEEESSPEDEEDEYVADDDEEEEDEVSVTKPRKRSSKPRTRASLGKKGSSGNKESKGSKKEREDTLKKNAPSGKKSPPSSTGKKGANKADQDVSPEQDRVENQSQKQGGTAAAAAATTASKPVPPTDPSSVAVSNKKTNSTTASQKLLVGKPTSPSKNESGSDQEMKQSSQSGDQATGVRVNTPVAGDMSPTRASRVVDLTNNDQVEVQETNSLNGVKEEGEDPPQPSDSQQHDDGHIDVDVNLDLPRIKAAEKKLANSTLCTLVRSVTVMLSYDANNRIFLTEEHLLCINRYHFLSDLTLDFDDFFDVEDDDKPRCHVNFACKHSQSLLEMIAMAYFLTRNDTLISMFKEFVRPIPDPEPDPMKRYSKANAFFLEKGNEDCTSYCEELGILIHSLCMMLVPGNLEESPRFRSLFRSRKNTCLENFELAMEEKLKAELNRPACVVDSYATTLDDHDLIEKEHEFSLVVNFLTKPRAVSLIDKPSLVLTDPCGTLLSNHRKVDRSALQVKKGPLSLQECWSSKEFDKLISGSASPPMHSGAFEIHNPLGFNYGEKIYEEHTYPDDTSGLPQVEGGLHFETKRGQFASELSLEEAYRLWMLLTVSFCFVIVLFYIGFAFFCFLSFVFCL